MMRICLWFIWLSLPLPPFCLFLAGAIDLPKCAGECEVDKKKKKKEEKGEKGKKEPSEQVVRRIDESKVDDDIRMRWK